RAGFGLRRLWRRSVLGGRRSVLRVAGRRCVRFSLRLPLFLALLIGFGRVVGLVPTRSLEVKRGGRDQFRDFALLAVRATSQRLVGDSLGGLERAAILATVFVDRHRP